MTMFPPAARSKKCAPKSRSNVKRNNPTVSGGNAKTIKAEATNAVHVKSGIRISFIPGARMFKIVTRKLIPPMSVPKPEICNPSE